MANHKLHPVRLGIALGLTWAIGMFLLGLSAWLFNYGTNLLGTLASIYRGFSPTLVGSFIGAGWGFVDLFITGLLIGWFYNCGCCPKKCCDSGECG